MAKNKKVRVSGSVIVRKNTPVLIAVRASQRSQSVKTSRVGSVGRGDARHQSGKISVPRIKKKKKGANGGVWQKIKK